MTAALSALPQPVREALDVLDGEAVCTCHEGYTSRGMKDPQCNHDLAEYVQTIRAELLRVIGALADLTGHGKIKTIWHAPGIGEIHDADHEYEINITRLDRGTDEFFVDDDAAREICAKLNRLDRAESELAALRKRIADAPVGFMGGTHGGSTEDTDDYEIVGVPIGLENDLYGMRVALLTVTDEDKA
jgi:hypothetical protein